MNKITFCINTSKNERPYLELLLQSLLNGIDVNLHDIIVFVDSDNNNVTEMLLAQKGLFPNLTIIKNEGEPVGYAGNINYMFSKAKTDIVSYLQSDMIVCLDYDKKLLAHIKDNIILCSTRVEPPLHAQQSNAVNFVENYGIVPAEFKYEEFLQFAEANKDHKKITNFFFAPFTLYKHVWNDIGGHDVSFKKSREDSDIALRFSLSGVEFHQCWDAIVYHFTCTSSRGIEWWTQENKAKEVIRQQNDHIELKRFVDKWGTFVHPSHINQIPESILKSPDMISKIKVVNPIIEEGRLKFL